MVTIQDAWDARERIKGITHVTPLFYSKTLSQMCDNEIYLKCENMQKTGSFKIRGAYNAVSNLTPEEKARGVVTGSSGNHGQALAYAANLLGVRSVIVMPEDAAQAKIAACQSYGGEVLLHGFTSEARLERALELVESEGLTMVHPFDNPHVIAGQATISLEILEQLPDVGYILAQIGGGGLLSGVSLGAKETKPSVKVLGVEPEVGARMRNAWNLGEVVELMDWQPSVADGMRTRRPGKLPFEVTRRYVDDLISVSEEEIVTATSGALASVAASLAAARLILKTALCVKFLLSLGK